MANKIFRILRAGVDQLRHGRTPTTMLAVGDTAPDFELPAHDGSTVSLSGLAGKHVVLWFYPVADTPG
ncbi:MAG: redoxin domain-containing protein [Myxococcales bacterium]|nr:redoxin domain-containing protein [Myxococcales bacterium]